VRGVVFVLIYSIVILVLLLVNLIILKACVQRIKDIVNIFRKKSN